MSATILELLTAAAPARVVVRMPNWLGDAIFALPAVRAVRRAVPRSRLELHARPAVAQVLAVCDGLADAIVEAGTSTPQGVLRDSRRLRGADACVLLPNSFAAVVPAWLAGVPMRAGAATDGRRWLLTHRVAPPPARHQAGYYRQLIGVGADDDDTDARLEVTAEARHAARRSVGSEPYVVLAPGAAYGPAKRWGMRHFAELGARLGRDGLQVYAVGSAKEEELCRGVAEACGGRSLAGATGGALFAGVLAEARLVVANDSGTLHLASALGTPVVAVFGATDPEATGPVTGLHRVLYRPAPCSPCGLRRCARPTHECMDAISPDDVVQVIDELLAAPQAGST